MNLPKTAAQERYGLVGLIEKVERVQQGFGVGLAGLGECPHDPGVATLLLDVVQRLPRPPEHRVPPVERRHDQLDDPHAVIATVQMGELVNDQSRALVVVEAFPEIGRDDQPGAQRQAPTPAARACRRSTRRQAAGPAPGESPAH